MSCGVILFSCGTEGLRFVTPEATLMIHDVSSFAHGKNEEIQASAKETKRLNKILNTLLFVGSKIGNPLPKKLIIKLTI